MTVEVLGVSWTVTVMVLAPAQVPVIVVDTVVLSISEDGARSKLMEVSAATPTLLTELKMEVDVVVDVLEMVVVGAPVHSRAT